MSYLVLCGGGVSYLVGGAVGDQRPHHHAAAPAHDPEAQTRTIVDQLHLLLMAPLVHTHTHTQTHRHKNRGQGCARSPVWFYWVLLYWFYWVLLGSAVVVLVGSAVLVLLGSTGFRCTGSTGF